MLVTSFLVALLTSNSVHALVGTPGAAESSPASTSPSDSSASSGAPSGQQKASAGDWMVVTVIVLLIGAGAYAKWGHPWVETQKAKKFAELLSTDQAKLSLLQRKLGDMKAKQFHKQLNSEKGKRALLNLEAAHHAPEQLKIIKGLETWAQGRDKSVASLKTQVPEMNFAHEAFNRKTTITELAKEILTEHAKEAKSESSDEKPKSPEDGAKSTESEAKPSSEETGQETKDTSTEVKDTKSEGTDDAKPKGDVAVKNPPGWKQYMPFINSGEIAPVKTAVKA